MKRAELRRLGGWVLVANAVVGTVLLLDWALDLPHPTPLTMLQLLGIILFLIGIPTIQAAQPETGRSGQAGIGLMELGSAIAFVLVLGDLVSNTDFPSSVPFTSALLGMIGNVLVGVLTIRARRFPVWAGWFLAFSGVINFATGQLSDAIGFKILTGFGTLMGILAIAQYGWTIVQAERAEQAEPRLV